MFKQSTAKLSLLLLAFLIVPSARLRADTGDSTDIITGSDPQPSGNPKPNAIGGGSFLFELELGILMAL